MNAQLHLVKSTERWRSIFRIGRASDCWEWRGQLDGKGYGQVFFCGTRRLAHRVSYERYVGEIESGLSVLHKCDNPPCVNPAHLYAGTQRDNLIDQFTRNRRNRGLSAQALAKKAATLAARPTCKRGHPKSGYEEWRKFKAGPVMLRCPICYRMPTAEKENYRELAR